jgi:hypothetical protein
MSPMVTWIWRPSCGGHCTGVSNGGAVGVATVLGGVVAVVLVVAAVVVVWVAVGVEVLSLLDPVMAAIKANAGKIAT